MSGMNTDGSAVPMDPFESWLNARHKWLQTAAARLIAKKQHPDADEIVQLAGLCIAEASDLDSTGFQQIAPGSLATAALRPSLRISSIKNVQGVNAIRNGAALTFGKSNISLIYGLNGSGKTGFARILKHASGNRFRGDLRQNVFEKVNKPTSAEISFSLDEVEQTSITWSLVTGTIASMKELHLFDTHVAAMYVTKENEATYEPSRMRFVSSLIKVCDRVFDHIADEKLKLVSKLPILPGDIAATSVVKKLFPLNHASSQEDIDKACAYTPELDAERVSAEAAIGQKDIPGRLKSIIRERAALKQINGTLGSLKAGSSSEFISNVVDARKVAELSRAAATESAKVLFTNAPLDGVGDPTWKALWKQARLYSEDHAYPGKEFPNTGDGSRCVLCHQDLGLDPDAKERLARFEAFVSGGLETEANTAEKTLSDLIAKIPACPSSPEWVVLASSLGVDEPQAKTMLAALKGRIDSIPLQTDKSIIPAFDWHPLGNASTAMAEAQNAEEKTLNDLLSDGKRKELEARILEIRAKQWLSQNQKAIESEIARLKQHSLLERASRLASTSALTTKNNALAEEEISAGYQKRFAKELEYLGGDQLPVRPVCKLLGKGKVAFGLALIDPAIEASAESILSEGEHRIIALAAFLADITGAGQKAPFVFDDPISSLDQDYEERVVERLVDLSKSRQVIVFTHRLSLLALLDSAVSKLSEQAELEKKPAVKLHVETLRRLGRQAGLTSTISVRDGKPTASLSRMRGETLPALKKLYEASDVENYDQKAEHFCTDFRILMERIVEDVLLNTVITRFRRSIVTKGKLGSLARITPEDCAFIDDLMTRYSVFEHSQSSELPSNPPDLSVLEKDVKALAEWAKEFKSRTAN